MRTRTEQVLVSLLYCGAMSGRPNLLYLWVLAGTPVTSLLLDGMGILGGRVVSYLSAFVWGLLCGAVQGARPESTAAPDEESSPYPRGC